MKEYFIINAYVLTDRLGEWWETVRSDGRLGNLLLTSAYDKEFKTMAEAIKYTNTMTTQCVVLKLTPPVAPSITWGRVAVYDTTTTPARAVALAVAA